MRMFGKLNHKKVKVEGNQITNYPWDWQEGDSTDDGVGSPIVHVETVDDGEAYIQLLLDNGYTEIV